MLSIIICSISKERLSRTINNIDKTIGLEHEIIVIDNLIHKYSITKAYNEGAKKARYPYLLFLHEDVRFHSTNWGTFILNKLGEPDCGVIGFAGTKLMLDVYSGWWQDDDWMSLFFYQGTTSGKTYFRARDVILESPFSEVVALDGMAMFVRRDVWDEFKFDEENLKGFHCYDVDFTLRIAASKRYKNYVCTSFRVLIEHMSEGSLNVGWISDTIQMHRTQWKSMLPMSVSGFSVDSKKLSKKKERIFHHFLRLLFQTDYLYRKQILREFLCYRFSWKHIAHCMSDIWFYLKSNKK